MKKFLIFLCIFFASVQVFAQCGDLSQAQSAEMFYYPGHHLTTGYSYFGQTFQVDCDSYVDSVRTPLYVFQVGAKDSVFIAFFEGVTYNNMSQLVAPPTFVPMSEFTPYVQPIPLSVPLVWSEIKLETLVPLEAGVTYSMCLIHVPVGGLDAVHYPQAFNVYPQGSYLSWNPNTSVVNLNSGRDLLFELHTTCMLPGDFDRDGVVGTSDLTEFLVLFGQIGEDLLPDMNNDLVINSGDLAIFLALFGTACGQ